jgi:hypothetical protein
MKLFATLDGERGKQVTKGAQNRLDFALIAEDRETCICRVQAIARDNGTYLLRVATQDNQFEEITR